MKITTKMVGIGTLSLTIFSDLFAVVMIANSAVKSAMDSIIDRDAGEIEDALMAPSNRDSVFLRDNLGSLHDLTDTDDEIQLGDELARDLNALTKGGQQDLITLIEGSAIRVV